MNRFRSICFVHEVQDSYITCYIKQFFKWVGFAYFEYIPGSMGVNVDILRKRENQDFDIMVSLNQSLQNNQGLDIASIYGERFFALDYEQDESAEDVMDRLMEQLKNTILIDCDLCAFTELYLIYKKYCMASILYEYTLILLNNLGDQIFDTLDNKLQNILAEMKQFEEGHWPLAKHRGMWEYFLFAKYFCQRKANQLCMFKEWVFYYKTEGLLKSLDEIYQYDPGFYRVEYLKAKVAEQSLMHRVYAKGFYFKGLEKSRIEVCKSYLYYQLGKWLENNKEIYEAGKAYLYSYKSNPTNLKAAFKLAVDAKRKRDRYAENKYLTVIIKNWELFSDKKQALPLMELEYAYKAYMLMDILMRKDLLDKSFYDIGSGILRFTQEMGSKADKDYFVNRLYTDSEREKVSFAIALRMDMNCKKLVED